MRAEGRGPRARARSRGEGEGQDERRKTGVAGRENEEVFGGELRNGPRVT